MHGQGNHPNGLVALKHRSIARMVFFGQDRSLQSARSTSGRYTLAYLGNGPMDSHWVASST
jgi:hypothetical protein